MGQPRKYLDIANIDEAPPGTALRSLLGDAYEFIRNGAVATHAVEHAPFARSLRRVPVLLFSHGGGAMREIYTAQLEDLASHGYAVIAITHTYDAALTVFPDGRRIGLHAPPGTPSEQEMNAKINAGIERMATDIRFVLHELMRLDKGHSKSLPFAGHLDFRRVGAFGHSEGGEAAARACQTETLIKACLDQDGVQNFAPFHPDSSGWGMDQPFLLLTRERDTPPTDSELEAMQMTRPQAEALIARLKAAQEAALSSTGGGGYKVLLKYGLTSHMSFSDLPVLEASDETEADRQSRLLNVIRLYTRIFFDEEFGQAKRGALKDLPPSEFVETVRYFEPAKRGEFLEVSARRRQRRIAPDGPTLSRVRGELGTGPAICFLITGNVSGFGR